MFRQVVLLISFVCFSTSCWINASVIHEGSCPATVSPSDDDVIAGLCVEACDNDGDCDEDQKCCTNGCGHLCMRAVVEPACPDMMCMMWCPHGFQQDRDGCKICECAPQTVIHEGDCPITAPDTFGTCATTCEDDGYCSSNEKCCSNGCAYVCLDAVIPDTLKVGSCPTSPLPSEMLGICSDLCIDDSYCNGTKKCCSNGCGRMCIEPLTFPVHSGSCPVGDLPHGAAGICADMCTHDGQCGPYQKCCSNGCGRVCINTTDVSVGCSDVTCQMFCEYGFQRDVQGCEVCACEIPVNVHPGTCPTGDLPYGVVGSCVEGCGDDWDCAGNEKCCSNGCGRECVDGWGRNNLTVSCLKIICSIYCPYGNLVDDDGCPVCGCNDVPAHCPEMGCMNYCEHGYERDEDGCETCTCSEAPEIRPGLCPRVNRTDQVRSIESNLCDNDAECPTNQKCCSDGRYYACVDALDVPPSCPEIMCMQYCPHGFKKDRDGCDVCECNIQSVIHEGECPLVEAGMVAICMEACEHDGNCSTTEKCCSNGCGHQCVDVSQSGVVKPGVCPVINIGIVGACVNRCTDDTSCSGALKCCSNGCGRVCMEPIPTVVRPGTCPTGLLSEGVMGACLEACHDDGDCSTNQKCCSNGCGHACVTVIEDPTSCSDVMCEMFCEFGFMRDSDGCDICSCNERPVIHLGSCPTLPADAIGHCMTECYNDNDCLTNQKCCSNGCGRTCQAATNASVVHEGVCPIGKAPGGILGICAELCFDDSSCRPNQKCCSNGCGHECIDITPDCSERPMCRMYCEFGYVKDEDGCDTCQCIEQVECPQVLCMIYCEHGSQRDENGCDTCVCNTEPVTCPPIMCNMWCENGFEQDENGCDICRCQTEVSCPEVMCMMYCENGFLRDENGCEICSCYNPPVVHPGSCPRNRLPFGTVGICIQACSDDGSCSANQKCCSNGCGHVCMDAILVPAKPGTCPIVRDGVFGVCAHMCGHDGQCDGDMKCCSNGCGLTCVEPGPLPKPGTCPNQTTTDSFGICVNECEHDQGCAGEKKCCHNGCGMTCLAPAPVSKPGECPAVLSNTIGLCVEDCTNDAGCPGDFKCCMNGCGHVCIDPSPDVASPIVRGSSTRLLAASLYVVLSMCVAIMSITI